MMTFLSALDEEGFLTCEVSDDVLEDNGERITSPGTTHSRPVLACLFAQADQSGLEAPVPNTFLNWTSRIAIAGRIAECRRPQSWNDLTILG
jgi:hypothetical protein